MTRGYPPLNPITPDLNRQIPGFGIIDIEASNWINFLVMGYYTKKKGEDFCVLFENITECAEWLFEKEQPHDIIYAHFGGKYDFQFMLQEYFTLRDKYFIDSMIPRGSGLLCLDVSTVEVTRRKPRERRLIRELEDGTYLVKKRTISFRDSSAMLPFGLASLTKNFNVEHKKKEFDFETMVAVTPELKEYLTYDLKGLYEVIEKYYNWPIIRGAGFASTIASQSIKVFQTYLKKPIKSLKDDVDAFVRKSYFGGRTEIFKPCFMQLEDNQLLKTFDVNSLYPSVMRGDFPGAYKKRTKYLDVDAMGFYDVLVEVPEMYVPPLATVVGKFGRLIFPTGQFRGTFSTIELKYAMTLGVRVIEVYEGIVFENAGPIFNEFINDIYEKRKAADKESVDKILCKLILNSTYGRFGLRRDREKLIIDDGRRGVMFYSSHQTNKGEEFNLVSEPTSLDSSFAHVGIAAWVTSQARILMHKLYMQAPDELWYTDTDSLFSTHDYPSNQDELGELKFEYSCDAACFLLPKTYLVNATGPLWEVLGSNGKKVKDDEGDTVKTSKKVVMKGFDKRKIGNFKMSDFFTALEGDLRYMKSVNPEKFATFKTAARNKQF